MLPFAPDRSVFQETKCYFSHGILGHIDAAQPPALESTPSSTPSGRDDKRQDNSQSQSQNHQAKRLRKPWSTIQALDFVSQLDIVLPQDCAAAVQQKLAERDANTTTSNSLTTSRPTYARVTMTLKQVLTGAFYTDYVQAGNVLMLSRGRVGQDNSVVALRGGRLTLFLQRQAYERAGLQGKPHGAKGGRNLRPRWVVESDLHAKTMRPGQPGHTRLLQACDNVFGEPFVWLFCSMFDTPSPDPLAAFNPTVVTVSPTVTTTTGVALPPLGRPPSLLAVDDDDADGDAALDKRLATEEAAVELYEWLSLVRLGSPRVTAADSIDPYLSRYAVPGSNSDSSDSSDSTGLVATGDIAVLRWTGFFSPTWACQTLLDVVLAMQPSSSSSSSSASSSSPPWFALSVASFSSSKGVAGDGAECTFFRPADAPHEYLLWDVHSHE